ncbi:hypothetical protein PoB_007475900 [Plakobranchus ocellatus]|uniref:Uncharacterized protein n=1 Tax=Plakobranchus ocellatus TaxID=259542 RepID=A0AAV4DW40_9GAST|nr:hypothetical protein PoB_007475900 [Plakobranchus ocellatus]
MAHRIWFKWSLRRRLPPNLVQVLRTLRILWVCHGQGLANAPQQFIIPLSTILSSSSSSILEEHSQALTSCEFPEPPLSGQVKLHRQVRPGRARPVVRSNEDRDRAANLTPGQSESFV